MANPGPAVTVSAHPSNLGTNQANRLLFVLKDLSVAAERDIKLQVINSSAYSVQEIVVANANSNGVSADVHLVELGLYTLPGQGGTAIYAAAALTGVTGQTVVDVISPTTTEYETSQDIYANIGGTLVDATIDLYVYGYDLSK